MTPAMSLRVNVEAEALAEQAPARVGWLGRRGNRG